MPKSNWQEILSNDYGIENNIDLNNFLNNKRLVDVIKENPRRDNYETDCCPGHANIIKEEEFKKDYARAVASSLGIEKNTRAYNLFIYFRMNKLWDWCDRNTVEYFDDKLSDIFYLGGVWGLQFGSLNHLYKAGIKSPGKVVTLLKTMFYTWHDNLTTATYSYTYNRGIHVGELIYDATRMIKSKNLLGSRFNGFFRIYGISSTVSPSPISSRYERVLLALDDQKQTLFHTLTDKRNWFFRDMDDTRFFRLNVVVKKSKDWQPLKINHQVNRAWEISVGRCPIDKDYRKLPMDVITSLNKKKFGYILKNKDLYLDENGFFLEHNYLALARLTVCFWGEVDRLVEYSINARLDPGDQLTDKELVEAKRNIVHDIGIHLPDGPINRDQVKFTKRYKHRWEDACRVLHNWESLVNEGIALLAKEGIKIALDTLSARVYDNVKNLDLAFEAAKWGYSQNEFEKVQRKWLGGLEKLTHQSIPKLDFVKDEYRCYILSKDDPRGIFLGEYTGCCQHPSGAGAQCAEHGHCDPNGGFFVIEKRGKIIAQSWVWRRDEILVFDNVEGGYGDLQEIHDLYLLASKRIANNWGIQNVLIGRGQSKVSFGGFPVLENFGKPNNYNGYTDSRSVWEIIGGGV